MSADASASELGEEWASREAGTPWPSLSLRGFTGTFPVILNATALGNAGPKRFGDSHCRL